MRSDFDEAETKAKHLPGNLRILVKSRCKTDRRGYIEAGDGRTKRSWEAGRPGRRHMLQRGNRQPVCLLGLEREGKGAEQG